MRHLNYNHLHYFWAVGREGSIASASKVLHLTPQTISGQLKLLEQDVGQPLFERSGRRLIMTEIGQLVFEYAEQIFSTGLELAHVVRGRNAGGPAPLTVGCVSSMPKLIVERIIAPVLIDDEPVRVRCHEASLTNLLAELSVHRLDLVLSDQALPQGLSIRAYTHRLGGSGMSFFARGPLLAQLGNSFPENLNDAPILLPTRHSELRRQIDDWLEANKLSPRIMGEFDDSALMKAFGEAGAGVFIAPSVIEQEVERMYRSKVIGRVDELQEQFYAISVERRLKHAAVKRLTETARSDLFEYVD